jgi:enediyne biosynthesis protein E7
MAKSLQIPPGPPDPYDPRHDLFNWMMENFLRYGDVYMASIYNNPVYVVSSPEYCERILRFNWRNYERKGIVVQRIAMALGNCLITSNGEFWVSQRRMVQTAFARPAIFELCTMIGNENRQLTESWRQSAGRAKKINVTRDVSELVLKVTLRAIFGDDYDTVAPHFSSFAETVARDFKFAQDLRPLRQLVTEIMSRRRLQTLTPVDSLGKLMQARDRETGAPMSDAQLVREVLTLVVAGHETTASLLNWMWYLIATHPDVENRLIDEFDRLPWSGVPAPETLPDYVYARQIIDEALRLYPPLWLMTRKAVNDDRLGDFLVRAGTEIYISPYLIQHRPDLWEVPDRFDPERISRDRGSAPELALCPFGAGPRNCIGEFFARFEVQLHLMMVARELRLRYDDTHPPELSPGLNLLSKRDFMMTPEIRLG